MESAAEKQHYAAIRAHLKKKYRANWRQSWCHSGLTLVGYFSLFWLSRWIPLYLYVLLQSLFTIKAFIIFHDAGHHSFFPNKKWNKLASFIFSTLTWTPVTWRVDHYQHHRNSSNIGQNQFEWNDSILYTTREFRDLKQVKKPLIFVYYCLPFSTIVEASYLWFFHYRFLLQFNKKSMISNHYHDIKNLALCNIAVLLLLMTCFYIGGTRLLIGYVVAGLIAGAIGVCLFRLQHNFNPAYVKSAEQWSIEQAALLGSSMIKIPRLLRWFSMGVEYHHIHHLAPAIPGYQLRACHNQADPSLFDKVQVIGWFEALKSLRLCLYDEDRERFVTMKQALRDKLI